MFKAKWAAFGGKDMFIYQGFVFGFLPCAYYLCHLPNSHLRAQTRQITDNIFFLSYSLSYKD